MRTLFLLITLNISFVQIILSQTNTTTLNETVDWLSAKLNCENKQYLKISGLWNHYKYVFDFDYEKNEIVYNLHSLPIFESSIEVVNLRRIPVESLNPENIKIEKKEWGLESDLTVPNITYEIVFLTTNNQKSILSKLKKDEVASDSFYLDHFKIILCDQILYQNPNLPNRVVDAMKHLMKLCGAKEEKF